MTAVRVRNWKPEEFESQEACSDRRCGAGRLDRSSWSYCGIPMLCRSCSKPTRASRRHIEDHQLPRESHGSRRPLVFFPRNPIRVMRWWQEILPIAHTDIRREFPANQLPGPSARCLTPRSDSRTQPPDSVMLLRRRLSRIFFIDAGFSTTHCRSLLRQSRIWVWPKR